MLDFWSKILCHILLRDMAKVWGYYYSAYFHILLDDDYFPFCLHIISYQFLRFKSIDCLLSLLFTVPNHTGQRGISISTQNVIYSHSVKNMCCFQYTNTISGHTFPRLRCKPVSCQALQFSIPYVCMDLIFVPLFLFASWTLWSTFSP